jgi:hypothetical protein
MGSVSTFFAKSLTSSKYGSKKSGIGLPEDESYSGRPYWSDSSEESSPNITFVRSKLVIIG